MKKILLALILVISLTACGKTPNMRYKQEFKFVEPQDLTAICVAVQLQVFEGKVIDILPKEYLEYVKQINQPSEHEHTVSISTYQEVYDWVTNAYSNFKIEKSLYNPDTNEFAVLISYKDSSNSYLYITGEWDINNNKFNKFKFYAGYDTYYGG